MRIHYRSFGLAVALIGVLLWGNGLVFNARAQVGSGVIRVANTGQDVDGCGSEAQPCATIARAVDQTRDYIPQVYRTAEIRVAKGTYKQSATDKKTSVAMLNFNGTLTLRGGYSTSNWNTSDPTANETIIDGENTYRGVSIVPLNKTPAAGCNIEVSNFTIINGLASAAMYDGPAGGGVVVNNGCVNARLSNLIVKNNKAQGSGSDPNTSFGSGGGIAIQGSDAQCGSTTVSLTNITLTNNVAQGAVGVASGGGLYSICGSVRGSNLTISGNTAKVGSAVFTTGGGISIIKTPTFTLSNLRVTQNTADGGNGQSADSEAGGIFVELSTGTISNANITGNSTTGRSANGGGLYAPSSNLTLENTVISQNQSTGLTADASSGGLLVNSTSTLNGKQVLGTLTGRNLFIGGNTVTSPTSSVSGGVLCDGVTLNLNNLTIASNSLVGPGDNYGAALAFIGGCSGKVSNSIVAQSGARAPVFANTATGRVIFDTTLFNVAAPTPFEDPGQKFANTNPLTGDPAFVSATDFHINARSAAIDKATGATPAEARDIDGETRPAGSAADLGADEFSSADARANTPITLNAAATTGSISLSWTAPANPFVEQYQITYAPTTALATRAAAVTVTVPNTQTSYTISGLTANATYTVTLTATGGGAQVGTATKSVAVVAPVFTFTYLPLTTR